MKNAIARASAVLLTAGALALPTLAAHSMDNQMVGALKLETPWTRATPGAAKAGGGFLTITNTGSEADRLTAAASPRAMKTEIHEMSVKDGVMVMRPVEGGVEIPAGATVELKPGGYHVMYMGIDKPFAEGESVPTTLTFEKAGTVEVNFAVEKVGAKRPDMQHGVGQSQHKMN